MNKSFTQLREKMSFKRQVSAKIKTRFMLGYIQLTFLVGKAKYYSMTAFLTVLVISFIVMIYKIIEFMIYGVPIQYQ